MKQLLTSFLDLVQKKSQQKSINLSDKTDIYLIGCKSEKTMKIGISCNVESRLQALQSANANKLEILEIIPGGSYKLERCLHKEFKELRIRGEWFKWSKKIIERFKFLKKVIPQDYAEEINPELKNKLDNMLLVLENIEDKVLDVQREKDSILELILENTSLEDIFKIATNPIKSKEKASQKLPLSEEVESEILSFCTIHKTVTVRDVQIKFKKYKLTANTIKSILRDFEAKRLGTVTEKQVGGMVSIGFTPNATSECTASTSEVV